MLCILCERATCIEDEVTCDDCTDYMEDYIEETQDIIDSHSTAKTI